MENYNLINDYSSKKNDVKQYMALLDEWFLYSEIQLINNQESILKHANANKRTMRMLLQPIFKNGQFNENRFESLMALIKS